MDGNGLMARKQKVLPEVEEVSSDGVPPCAQGKQQEQALSAVPASDEPEKHWRSMAKEPRQFPARPADPSVAQTPSQVSRTNRYTRYEAVRALHEQAISEREIARRLHLSRQTVHRFLMTESFPERVALPYRGSFLDPYKPYILDCWKAGCWNGCQLFAEVRALGFTRSEALFRLFISSLRKHHQAAGNATSLTLDADGAKVSSPASDPASKPCIKRCISSTRASWLYVSQPTKLDEKHRGQIEQIRAVHRDLDTAYQLTQTFVALLAEHQDTGLDDWLVQAEHSGIKELRSFARGIRRDYATVRATFTSEWSNGKARSSGELLEAPETTDVWESQLRSASTTGIPSCVVLCELCYRPQTRGIFSASRLGG